MRSLIIVAVAGAMGALLLTVLDTTLPQSAIPYNGDALRTAIADGMSRAGATVVHAESGTPESRH